jgi:hypothetical protein
VLGVQPGLEGIFFRQTTDPKRTADEPQPARREAFLLALLPPKMTSIQPTFLRSLKTNDPPLRIRCPRTVPRTPSGTGSHLFHLPTRHHAGHCSLVAVLESVINVIYDTAGDAKSRAVGPGGLIVKEEDANAMHSVGGFYVLVDSS